MDRGLSYIEHRLRGSGERATRKGVLGGGKRSARALRLSGVGTLDNRKEATVPGAGE